MPDTIPVNILRGGLALIAVLLLSGCAGLGRSGERDGAPIAAAGQPGTAAQRAPEKEPGAPAATTRPRPQTYAYVPPGGSAVATLLKKAQRQVRMKRYVGAAATLERALRIEPRNADIWSRLAEVRLIQGKHRQAEALAEKSSSLAGENRVLLARNWHIMAQARHQLGDSAGARAAEEQAFSLESR